MSKRKKVKYYGSYFRNGYWIVEHEKGYWCIFTWENSQWKLVKTFTYLIEARKWLKNNSLTRKRRKLEKEKYRYEPIFNKILNR